MFLILMLGSLSLTAWGFSTSFVLTSLANKHMESFYFWVSIMIISLIIWSIQIHLDSWYYTKTVQKMNIEIRKDIAHHVGQMEYQDFQKKDTGEYTSWMTNDINMINDYGYATLHMIITQILTILFGSIALFTFHYSLNILVIMLAIIMIVVPKFFSKQMDKNINDVSNENESFTKHSNDIFDNYTLYYSTNNEETITKKFVNASQSLADKKLSLAKLTGAMYGTTNFVSLFSQVIIILVASILFLKDLSPIGTITAAQYFSATIFTSLIGLSANYVELKTTQPIFEKFFESKKRSVSKAHLSEILDGIEFSNVSVKYDQLKILDQVNFKFELGKKYALVGPSGSGKSTILKLLMGLIIDYEGTITVDGKDIRNFSKESWVNHFAYLEQTATIINGTLSENINISITNKPKEITELLNFVGLSYWLNGKNIDEYIVTHKKLSGGQKQKLSYARALMKDAKIILFDEGTSALDRESALVIEDHLLSSNKTVIIITHQLTDRLRQKIDKVYYLR